MNKIVKKLIIFLFVLLPLSFPVFRNVFWYKINPWMAFVACFHVTRWAPGFSEQAFDKITIGDQEGIVRNNLGDPLKIMDTEEGPIWYYTSGPTGEVLSYVAGSTHIRGVCFDYERKVRKKLKYFYFD